MSKSGERLTRSAEQALAIAERHAFTSKWRVVLTADEIYAARDAAQKEAK